jgi:DNA-binding NarL/FixJ family response regulator
MRVFLVDDALVIRQRLTKMLATLKGVQVIGEAEEADDAIQAIRRLRPDVVILDLQLLKGTGFDVLKAIKQDNPAPVVILLTNFPYPRFRQKCLEAGANFFFDKSTEFQKIPNVLLQLSQAPRCRRESFSLRTAP